MLLSKAFAYIKMSLLGGPEGLGHLFVFVCFVLFCLWAKDLDSVSRKQASTWTTLEAETERMFEPRIWTQERCADLLSGLSLVASPSSFSLYFFLSSSHFCYFLSPPQYSTNMSIECRCYSQRQNHYLSITRILFMFDFGLGFQT